MKYAYFIAEIISRAVPGHLPNKCQEGTGRECDTLYVIENSNESDGNWRKNGTVSIEYPAGRWRFSSVVL